MIKFILVRHKSTDYSFKRYLYHINSSNSVNIDFSEIASMIYLKYNDIWFKVATNIVRR